MSVTIDISYDGSLHCTAIHGPSGDRILTDAPVDNRGKGEHFSPTDLLAASIGTCALTLMGIAAEAHGIDLRGARAQVVKEMKASPRRHIARLEVRIQVPHDPGERARKILEQAARGCPVQASLGPLTQLDLDFVYG